MPPKDITQTGPLTWKDLQKANQQGTPVYNSFVEEWKATRRPSTIHNAAVEEEATNYRNPVQWALELQDAGYGDSRYDIYTSPYHLEDLANNRGLNQSGLEQIANGIIKGAITTGTTFVDILAGIPMGVMTAVAEGRLSGIWDNAVTNAMQSVTDWSEETFPNYYTAAQQNAAWYAPENLFSANFLGDKLIKNFGFSLGAGLGMKVVSRIPKLLPKLAKSANVAKAINTAETSFVGAVGEGSIEALNGTKEWAEQNRNLIESERSQSMAALDLKYSQLEQSLRQQYGGTEMYQSLMVSLQNDYQNEANQINAVANQKVAALQNQIDDQGNLILAGNIPILWGSNILTLGKMMARGYNASESSIGKYVRKATTPEAGRAAYESTLTSTRQALRYAKTPVLEGVEEMNQAVISTAAKNRAQDYYNISVDPDATDATKSYMGYIWDAMGKTYGDINNYEEFVIGMLSSGISDIVVGQGKALRDERRQVNEAVARANDAINNFNNRTLLQNMNRQQVLEDQKLDAALRNDKKDYKDSEFGQIASAVITFSQIGKIEDLKAMLDANLTNMTDEDLENLAAELSQKDDSGAETNAFTLMSNKQRREYLAKQKAAYDKTIADYDKIREDLIAQTGTLFSPEQQAELIFYRLRANNANDRINEIDSDIQTKILNETTWTPQTLKKLGLDEDRVYTKQEVADAVANFNGSNKQLSNLFKGQSVEQLFLDKDSLEKDVEKYNKTVLDFIANPQKLEQKNNKIRNSIDKIITDRKVKRIVPQFTGINTFSDFTRTLQSVDPKLQKAVLDELIKEGNTEAKSFADKTTYARYIGEVIESIDADDYIKDRAAQLIMDSIDKQTLNATKDLDNPLYSRNNNSDLSDAEYNELYKVLANTLGQATAETESTITEEAPIKPEPKAEEVSDKDFFAEALRSLDAAEAAATTETPAEPKAEEKLTDVETIIPNTVVAENTNVLSTPAVGTNNGNLHDTQPIEDNRELGVKPVAENPLADLTRLSTGVREVETKVGTNGYGKPITEQTDDEGNKTQAAKDLTPIYNRLKELHAFENIDNGTVKVGSMIYFALDTTMKDDHVVDGETITYDEPAVLLYIGDKCVGNLSTKDAKQLGILDKLKEEFGNKTSDTPMISQKYYTLCDSMEHGLVQFGNWHKLTNNELDAIRERMANVTTSKEDVTPIIAVYDSNEGAFVRSNTSEKYYIGKQIGPTFYGKFYKGRAALLIPTGAYNSQSDNQPNKSFYPVGLNRIKAKDLSSDSATYKQLRGLFKQIFKADCTAGELNKIVGEIRKLITYDYHVSATESQAVFIDAAFPAHNSDGSIVYNNGQVVLSPIANHSWFTKNKVDPAQGKFTHLRIKWQQGNGNVMTAAIQTHTGNVTGTQSFNDDFVEQQVDALMKMFLEDLNSYVNVDKNRLVDPNYVEQLINEGILETNVDDMRVIGNNFTMSPKVYEQQIEETHAEAKTETEQPKQPTTTFEVPDVEDEDLGRYRRETQRTTDSIINIDNEVDRIMKMLPQLDRNKVFRVVDTLIKVNNEGTYAMGKFERGIITLSNIAESGTAYHEAFHLVFNMLLNKKEKTDLLNEYKQKYPKLTQLGLEEQMAEDFRDFMMTRESRTIGQKIVDFFKDLMNIIKTWTGHKATFDTTASKIWRGRYAGTELNATEQIRNAEASMQSIVNDIQKAFEKRSQPGRGFDIGTYIATSDNQKVQKVNSIKELIVKRNGKYFLNMGIKYDKFEEYSPDISKKISTTVYTAGKSPLEVFNQIIKDLDINNLKLIEHQTNYVDANGKNVIRYEVVMENTNNVLPLEVLKDIESGNFTKTPEELYQEQSDPFNKEDQCGYTK